MLLRLLRVHSFYPTDGAGSVSVRGENPPCTAYRWCFCPAGRGQRRATGAGLRFGPSLGCGGGPGLDGIGGTGDSYPVVSRRIPSAAGRIPFVSCRKGHAVALPPLGTASQGRCGGVPTPPPIPHTSRSLRSRRKAVLRLALRVKRYRLPCLTLC